MSSCAIIPKVLNKNNEIVDSKLFRELTSIIQKRDLTVNVYKATKLDTFKNLYPNLKLDENSEVLLSELITKTDLDKIIGVNKILDKINTEGEYSTYREGIKEAIKKNENNPFSEKYVVVPSNNTFNITTDTRLEDIKKENSYNDYIRKTLDSWGVAVGALDSHEEYLGLQGITDFSRASKTLDGMVELIRLAKGEKGEKALSEEFAHLALEMMSTPLKSRIYNSISEEKAKEVLGDLYDSYYERYNNFEDIQKEVAGKLFSKALENNYELATNTQKNLLQRLIEFFKNFFSKFNHFDLLRAKTDIETNFNKLAKEVLNGGLKDEMSLLNITATQSLAKMEEIKTKESLLKEAIKKAINTEEKRALLFKSDKEFLEKQKLRIEQLNESLVSDNTLLEGFSDYVFKANSDLDSLLNRLKNIKGTSIEEEARVLRQIRDYAASYENVLGYTSELLNNFDIEEESKEVLDSLYSSMSRMRSEINRLWEVQSKSILKRIVTPLMGEEVIVPFGKNASKKFSVDDMIDEAFEDIGALERWFLPMNVSSDIILQSIDYTLKDKLHQARIQALNYERKILELQRNLGSGVSTEFMFERDEKGNLTGRYISNYDTSKYRKERNKFVESLYKRFNLKKGDNPREVLIPRDYRVYKRLWGDWLRENTVREDGVSRPADKYISKAYTSLTARQKEYYTKFLEIKKEMDELLPEGMTELFNAVKVRTKSGESLRRGDIKGLIKEKLSDFSLVTGEDSERLGSENALTDFSGNVFRYLPMHYINISKGEGLNNMSVDATSSLIIYGNAIARYNQLDSITNTLEVSYMALKERDVRAKKNGLSLKSSFRNLIGEKSEDSVYLAKGSAKLIGRLRDYLDKNLYQEGVEDYKKEFGGKVYSLRKANDALMSYTALKGMGLNFASQFANIVNGFSQNIIESIWAKEKFNHSDLVKAHQIYFNNLGDIIKYKETGETTNKLALVLRLIDANQDWDSSIKERYSGTAQLLLKHLNSSLLTIGQSLGDHYLKHITSLAYLSHKKVKLNGKEINFLDALEEAYIDPNNKQKGITLKLKEGVTDLIDNEINLDDFLSNISQQITKLNQRMYGVYNNIDKPALSKYILGNWLLTFKNWLPRMLHARLAKTHYNVAEKEWEQGYYTSYTMVVKELYKMKKDLQLLEALKVLLGSKESAKKLGFDDKVIYNIQRTLTDVAMVMFFTLASIILSHIYGLDEDDDEKRKENIKRMSQLDKYLMYFIVRNEVELGTTSPFAFKVFTEQSKSIINNTAIPANTLFELIHNTTSMIYIHDIEGLHVGNDEKVWGMDKRYKKGEDPIWKYSRGSAALTRLVVPFIDNTSKMDDPLKQAKNLLIYRK